MHVSASVCVCVCLEKYFKGMLAPDHNNPSSYDSYVLVIEK